jgi:hypothetical protein
VQWTAWLASWKRFPKDDDDAAQVLFLAMMPDLHNLLDCHSTVLVILRAGRAWTNGYNLSALNDLVELGLCQRVSVEVTYTVYIPRTNDS